MTSFSDDGILIASDGYPMLRTARGSTIHPLDIAEICDPHMVSDATLSYALLSHIDDADVFLSEFYRIDGATKGFVEEFATGQRGCIIISTCVHENSATFSMHFWHEGDALFCDSLDVLALLVSTIAQPTHFYVMSITEDDESSPLVSSWEFCGADGFIGLSDRDFETAPLVAPRGEYRYHRPDDIDICLELSVSATLDRHKEV